MTAKWRAKLAEYALDRYLTASHDELRIEDGGHTPLSHDKQGAVLPAIIFASPESDTVPSSLVRVRVVRVRVRVRVS